ncbi:MAG TPA: efflux RND transporter permease subunit, partial [candidate division Zixibacteria bacterium]|nr:efflux RND transporter permease subunit [candidate division Zixibacteria bacterium]
WNDNEVHILLDPVKIKEFGINPQQVQMALMANNVNMPAGYLVRRNKEFRLRTYGQFNSLDEIKNIVVGMTKDYKPIYLRDIAEVKLEQEESRGIAEFNHKKALWIMISKESGANTVNVMRRVNKEIEEIKKLLPRQTSLDKMFDMSEMVTRVIKRTASNGIVGALLAVLFIYLFLRSWRPTLAISLAIPLSVIATFIAIYAAGYTLNVMTMVGLSLGVGMLVDNAVVVIENIYRRIEEGENRFVAAGKGATQVGMAITASTLTTIAVFFPVLFVPGITGQLSRGLALTVAFSLLASLFVALTLVPVIAAQIFKKERSAGMEATKWFRKLRDKYTAALKWALHHKTLTIAVVGFIFLLSLALIPVIGGEFIPKMDPAFAQVFFSLPQGTPMEQTYEVANQLLAAVEEEPDVLFSGLVVGTVAGSEFDISGGSQGTPTNVNEGAIYLRLKYKEHRKLSNEQIVNKMRRAFPSLKNAKFVSQNNMSQMIGGISADIEVKIYGDDLDVLRRLAKVAADSIKNIPGVSDYDLSFKEGRPELRIVVNKEKCARLGLSAAEVASAVHTYTLGAFAGRF